MGRNILPLSLLVIYLKDIHTDCAANNECISEVYMTLFRLYQTHICKPQEYTNTLHNSIENTNEIDQRIP